MTDLLECTATPPVGASQASRPRPLSPQEEAVVRALGRVMTVLPRVLDTELLREQRLALSEYTALMHLCKRRADSYE